MIDWFGGVDLCWDVCLGSIVIYREINWFFEYKLGGFKKCFVW